MMRIEGVVNYRDLEFEVSGEYAPFIPGKPYLRNGDPGYPDEGDYFEEFDIRINGSSIYESLTQKAIHGIESLALNTARERSGIWG